MIAFSKINLKRQVWDESQDLCMWFCCGTRESCCTSQEPIPNQSGHRYNWFELSSIECTRTIPVSCDSKLMLKNYTEIIEEEILPEESLQSDAIKKHLTIAYIGFASSMVALVPAFIIFIVLVQLA